MNINIIAEYNINYSDRSFCYNSLPASTFAPIQITVIETMKGFH